MEFGGVTNEDGVIDSEGEVGIAPVGSEALPPIWSEVRSNPQNLKLKF